MGPSRHFAASQQLGRFRSEADIHRTEFMSTRSGLHSSKLHRIDRRLAREDAGDVARAFGLQLLERLDRVECGVRGEDHVVAAETALDCCCAKWGWTPIPLRAIPCF